VPTRFVIVHDEWGIFVGTAMGGAFWTNMHPAGQDTVATFESPKHAEQYLKTWEPSPPEGLRAVPVQVSEGETHASIAQCVEAGLDAWKPDFQLAKGTVQGELASIIEKVDRLINDAAAIGDEDYAMRIGVVCRTLSNAASRRSRAIHLRLKGVIHEAMAFEAASQDALERSVSVLDDRKWGLWKDDDKVPTPSLKIVKPEHGAANDSLSDPDDVFLDS